MGAGDLSDFRVAGKTLFSLGLVKGAEGNLSTLDGGTLRITRAGAALADLEAGDVLEGTLDAPPAGASSDLGEHVWLYGNSDGGAVVHAHPPGSVPDRWREGEPHGVFATGPSLQRAVAAVVEAARRGALGNAAAGWDADEHLGDPDLRPVRPLEHVDGRVRLLDQTRLPTQEVYLDVARASTMAGAIGRLAVRGAPVMGIAAAYGLALEAARTETDDLQALLDRLDETGRDLVATRPTAVNIGWAVERVRARAATETDVVGARAAVLEEARRIETEDAEACAAMGRLGAALVPKHAKILTHCNTGMLCTAGIGTAQGVIYRAHLEGKGVHVWVDETRPVWQGARLTAWELRRLGVPMTLVPDGAAASLMAADSVDLVIVGADRIAANGDVANKIGTYGLAVLARYHDVPFYVAAPTATIDLSTPSGADIAVEERDPAEVTTPRGVRVAPDGTPAANPAFDVTPAELVTALVTERGVARPPYGTSLRAHVGADR